MNKKYLNKKIIKFYFQLIKLLLTIKNGSFCLYFIFKIIRNLVALETQVKIKVRNLIQRKVEQYFAFILSLPCQEKTVFKKKNLPLHLTYWDPKNNFC